MLIIAMKNDEFACNWSKIQSISVSIHCYPWLFKFDGRYDMSYFISRKMLPIKGEPLIMFYCGWVLFNFTHVLQDCSTGTGQSYDMPQCQYYHTCPCAYQWFQGCACKVCGTHRLKVKWQKRTGQRSTAIVTQLCLSQCMTSQWRNHCCNHSDHFITIGHQQ